MNPSPHKYPLIQKELIQEKLNLAAYPTHIVVDENGNIKRVFDNASELISYIEKDTSLKKTSHKGASIETAFIANINAIQSN
jgi:hypothetical protein